MATNEKRESGGQSGLKLHGLLAEYGNVDDLIGACEQVRDAGYRKWDAHSPFPVHGIDDAMGIRPTILPWIVLCGGLFGLSAALWMQWWMNAVDYPYLISGKPFFSLPANIPVCFELTVLFSALTAFFAVLALNKLPELYSPLFRSRRFLRATDDRFFIAIDASDPGFHPIGTNALLASQNGSIGVEEVMETTTPAPVPKGLIGGVIVFVCLAIIPLALAVRARFSTSEKPRLHLVWDMDWQKKYKAQQESSIFPDGRAMRPQEVGTLARGDLAKPYEMPFHTGVGRSGQPITNFPLEVTPDLMDRGRERYGIFCAPCHGLSGYGDGMVARRAERLGESAWVPPLTYHSDALRGQPVGQMYQTITDGVRTMPAYGSQIPPRDRWAIILYIRALQRSRHGSIQDVPAEKRDALLGN